MKQQTKHRKFVFHSFWCLDDCCYAPHRQGPELCGPRSTVADQCLCFVSWPFGCFDSFGETFGQPNHIDFIFADSNCIPYLHNSGPLEGKFCVSPCKATNTTVGCISPASFFATNNNNNSSMTLTIDIYPDNLLIPRHDP